MMMNDDDLPCGVPFCSYSVQILCRDIMQISGPGKAAVNFNGFPIGYDEGAAPNYPLARPISARKALK
ncbi:hypothetical protein DdX_04786 [Ditylenchus destructor]|uniref:Uncharacterized protein n=1 Tax=Ditylenchus destructor TaxID=166010 RepID=A0AAD4R3V0_9BILA|nr:hypothetical protein DdX_04786 [Ditylenchus destructor]